MQIRLRVIAGFMTTGLGAMTFYAQAASFHALDLPAPATYDNQPAISDSARHEYVSQGQDYLRQYVRENLRRFISDSGILAMDSKDLQTAATLNLSTLAAAPSSAPTLWENKVRVWATEDLNEYFTCGRFVPMCMEMESNYKLSRTLDLSARVRAPFNNVLQVDLGSSMHWTSQVSSHWQYSLQNDTQVFGNFNVGLGFQWFNWQASLDCDLTQQHTQQQRFMVGKSF
jgi:hypothetical protein